MDNNGTDWSEDDTMFLFRVFLTEPAGSLRTKTPRILELSELLGRTPGSIHRKLEDIRSSDPLYLKTGKKKTNGAKLISVIWDDIYTDYDHTMSRIDDAYESIMREVYMSAHPGIDPGEYKVSTFREFEVPPGLDVPYESAYRDGQQVFRRQVAGNFDRKCCITGITTNDLLVASHIKPWKDSTPVEKTDVQNGLYLNRLHDGLFDRHLMTIDEDLRVVYAESVRQENPGEVFESFFGRYEGVRIHNPIFGIGEVYLEDHRKVFKSKCGSA